MGRVHSSKRLGYRFWLGVAISAICLVLVFRNARWSEIWTALQSVSWPFIVLGQVFFISNLLLRAARWRTLLLAVGRLSLIDAFAYLMIGYVANDVLPLRLGEFVRVVLLGENRRLGKGGILATIVIERLLDILTLLVFIAILSLSMKIPPMFRRGIFGVEIAAAVILLILWLFSLSEDVERWLDRFFSRFIPRSLRERTVALGRSFIAGLQGLRNARQARRLLVSSILAWIFTALNVACVLRAFGLSSLPWCAPLFVVTLSNLGTMLPSSPGSVGVAHFFLTTSLTILSVDRSTALGFALVHHGLLFTVTAGLGLAFLLRENMTLTELSQRFEHVEA
ncbi:MAG: flippase-like domain-containing protein [Anaerolineae bacterium]|nr:MAG: flippase-like domain-containing protein [Anaerolineae bacterium]